MILEEILEKLDRSENNKCNSCIWDLGAFQQELDIYPKSVEQDKDNPRLIGYWVAHRYNSDGYVGVRAYFFDGKFAALTIQDSDDGGENFSWSSEAIAYEIREYIMSLFVKPELRLDIIGLKEELGDGLGVYFTSELIGDVAIYKGKKVKIVKRPWKIADTKATIQHDDGLEEEVVVEELLMPWKLVE